MNNIVYVCGFHDVDEEDLICPLAVYTNEEDAILWCKENKGIGPDNYYRAAYKIMALNEPFNLYDETYDWIEIPSIK